ncbi:hypothetical protein [Mycoplasma phocoenae]|uniref:Uncharacterized protein n=1 Tax=Mycoplasma phocoenae TaxID=754517 RepID=A0A858U346_9MOLU|nr:hypothetical protein [Mycoplasma phocoenae]QJG66900.1 hypothetical protein HGG69_00985 [Mycoplasma phocoenae]
MNNNPHKNYKDFLFNNKNHIYKIANKCLGTYPIPLTCDDLYSEAIYIIHKIYKEQECPQASYILKACEFRFKNIIRQYTSKKNSFNNNINYFQNIEQTDVKDESKSENNWLYTELLLNTELNSTEKQFIYNKLHNELNNLEIMKLLNLNPYFFNKMQTALYKKINDFLYL